MAPKNTGTKDASSIQQAAKDLICRKKRPCFCICESLVLRLHDFSKNDLFQDIEFGIGEKIRFCCVTNQKLIETICCMVSHIFFTRCFDLNEPICFLRKSFFHDPNSCEVGTVLKFQGFWNQTVHFMFARNPSCARCFVK